MLLFANLVVFAALLSAASGYTYTACDPCVNQASNATLDTLRLGVYGATIDDYTEGPLSDPLALRDHLTYDRQTYVYIYGWTGETLLINRAARDAVVEALIGLGCCNVLQLNWNVIASNLYDYAARSVEGVGHRLAGGLNELIEDGLDLPGLHIVGHSLGAQIAGFTGKGASFTLPRITGLDPAGPGFHDEDRRLNEFDAQFVMAIHTDGGGLGFAGRSGHVDFYPNGGHSPQPGCLFAGLNICSHFRACYFFEESVRDPTAFIGVFCDSWGDFRDGFCAETDTVVMGLTTPVTARGRVYLQTNSQPPYGREEDGAIY